MKEQPTPEARQDISKLYQQGATETPSKQLDQRLLAKAKQQTEAKVHQISDGRLAFRKWQWPVSVAASMMLVAVLFVHNVEQYAPPPPTLHEPVAEGFSDQVNTSQIPVNEKSADLLSDSAAEKVEMDVTTRELTTQEALTSTQARIKQKTTAAEWVNKADEEMQAVALPTQPEGSVHNKRDPAIEKEQETLNLTYLEALVEQISQQRANRAKTDRSQSALSEQGSADPQQALFEYLKAHVKHKPDAQIPETYLRLLTEHQRAQLNKLKGK